MEQIDEEMNLANLPKPERLRATFLAAVTALPLVGGPLARILEEELPSKRWERLQKFLSELGSRLDALEGRIETNLVHHSEVIELIEQAMFESAATENDTKHEALAGFVASALTGDSPDWEETRFLLAKVSQLSPLHLRLLFLIDNPEGEVERIGKDPKSLQSCTLRDVLSVVFEGIDPEIIRSAWQDLYTQRFLDTDANIFGTLISTTGLETVRGRLRPLGEKFVALCQTGAKR